MPTERKQSGRAIGVQKVRRWIQRNRLSVARESFRVVSGNIWLQLQRANLFAQEEQTSSEKPHFLSVSTPRTAGVETRSAGGVEEP